MLRRLRISGDGSKVLITKRSKGKMISITVREATVRQFGNGTELDAYQNELCFCKLNIAMQI